MQPQARQFFRQGGVLGAPQSYTALNAVASTWGLTGPEYAASLAVES